MTDPQPEAPAIPGAPQANAEAPVSDDTGRAVPTRHEDAQAHAGATPSGPVLCPGCLHDGVLERTMDRAEAAEAKLSAIAAYIGEHKGDAGFSWMHAQDILAIVGNEEEAPDGR